MVDKKADLSLCAGHRERLRQNFLDDKLAKYELLELLLSYAIPRKDVRPLARILYKKFGGIYPILSAGMDDLTSVPGVGKNIATFIKLVQRIMIEGYKCKMESQPIFFSQEQFNNYCLLLMHGKHTEELHVMYLDTQQHLLKDELHSSGSIDYTDMYQREIVKTALDLSAKFVVLIHNHPTPNSSFSEQDVRATRALKIALDAVGITLHDHYVASGGITYSMKDCFLL